MKYELKKVTKIIDEVLTFCMHTYHVEKADVSLKKETSGWRMVFQIHPVQMDAEALKSLNSTLTIKRNPELEDYYWQLTGELENSSELALVAMMCDEIEVEYANQTLVISILRKNTYNTM